MAKSYRQKKEGYLALLLITEVQIGRSTRSVYKDDGQVRSAPRHAGPAHSESCHSRPRPRVCDRAAAAADLAGNCASASRIALSGPASTAEPWFAHCGLERDRYRTRRQ